MKYIRIIRSTLNPNTLSNCNSKFFNSQSRILILSKYNDSSFQNYSSSSKNYSISPLRNFASYPSPTNKRSNKVEVIHNTADTEGIKIDMDLVNHLERTSLVDFDNEEALKRLEEAVQFANTLFEVDTTGVEPLISVLELEDVDLFLREDKVGPTSRDDILANASVTEEDYFVAPPGNIPLESTGSFTKKNR